MEVHSELLPSVSLLFSCCSLILSGCCFARGVGNLHHKVIGCWFPTPEARVAAENEAGQLINTLRSMGGEMNLIRRECGASVITVRGTDRQTVGRTDGQQAAVGWTGKRNEEHSNYDSSVDQEMR